MKLKGQHEDFQGKLQAMKVSLESEIEKLKREKNTQVMLQPFIKGTTIHMYYNHSQKDTTNSCVLQPFTKGTPLHQSL